MYSYEEDKKDSDGRALLTLAAGGAV